MTAQRSYKKLRIENLDRLKGLAVKEHQNFFARNPHLRPAFDDGLIGICLCQGAALHYLDPSVGVKDYDVWHFYVENDTVRFPYRAHYRSRYKDRRVDFLKRAVPKRIVAENRGKPDRVILAYLLERDTKTKRQLLRKAVVGLHPHRIFGKVIWRTH